MELGAYQALPAGWRISEDSHGRTFFINEVTGLTQWIDPRHNESLLRKYDAKDAPNVVRIGFALFDIQTKSGFFAVDDTLLGHVLQKREGTDPKALIAKNVLKEIVGDCLKATEKTKYASQITDRLLSLFDLKFEGTIEYRVAILGLIFLSALTTFKKIQYAFLVLDTTRKGRLNQESLFVVFKVITKLIENPFYRYKLVMSNRNLVGDVVSCLQAIKVTKGRVDDGTITFDEFVAYATDDPLILRPLSMLEKIQISRGVQHAGKRCASCSQEILGIRYKSNQGKQNMCESCFWRGQESAIFKKKDAFIEYPTEHKPSRIVSQKASGRYLPSMKSSKRVPDVDALRAEEIDATGALIDPSSVSRKNTPLLGL